MEPIIKVENLSKQYRLGAIGTGTLAHDLTRWWFKVRGKEDPYLMVGESNDRTKVGDSDYVWALKDIDFEVQQGEILGIIGKNGAGKSTLLKLLSRVTAPTTGKITCHGRIASLLEVGTGFHPELTGRENIYLNGAILGMTKKEIGSKFDEIVEFAGCQKYIETPVKRYSSGMYVRLAFAVAAHLEPDILVVDEVLAVGDAEFQKKAIGKMQDVSQNSGRTVLFVSHNMAAVKSLCTRAIVLKNGSTVFEGKTDDCVSFYLGMDNAKGNESLRYFSKDTFSDKDFEVLSFGVKAKNKEYGETISISDEIHFNTDLINKNQSDLKLSYRFKDDQGHILFVTSTDETKNYVDQDKVMTTMTIPSNFLNQGSFFVDIQISNGRELLFREEDAISFSIIQEKISLGQWMGKSPGALKPNFDWSIK